MPKIDALDRAMDRWSRLWKELQLLAGNRIVRKDRDARIAALRAEIAELEPAVRQWKKRFFERTDERNARLRGRR